MLAFRSLIRALCKLLCPLRCVAHQDCVDNWERQRCVHAIVQTGGLILLMRCRAVAGQSHKVASSIPTQPGQVIGLPQFDSDSGRQTHMVSYTVRAVICHLGSTLSSGHYITALSVPGSLLGRTAGWKWLICDDGVSQDWLVLETWTSLHVMRTWWGLSNPDANAPDLSPSLITLQT